MKIEVDENVFWGVKALAADSREPIARVFGELVNEALRARALNGAPPTSWLELDNDELLLMAGFESETPEAMRNRLFDLGRMCWIEEKIEAGEGAE
jgi:hypothetical protein